ncbi:MAG: S41 family peptidase [Candidatus Margulisbacteria bacterium]|nr:S41 family peptidase [Candidatus Margulisiibacteriota bacterium]
MITTKRPKFKLWAAIILISITAFSVGKVVAQGDMERKLETYLQVLDIVKNDYVNKNLDDQKLVYGSIRGLLEALDDPYTRFMEPKSYKEMKMRMSGSYSGIGIYIGIKNNTLAVIAPIIDTPAKKMGLRSGDYIIKIDGKETKNMALEEAVSLIRGLQGSKVKLSIIRNGWKEPKDFEITRAKIEIKSVVRKEYEGLAYIKINTFENLNTTQEFEKALRASKNYPGLIIDVRDNGGGLLQNAIDIGSMFIARGDIVQTVDREGRKEQIESTGRVLWTKPVVMLINEGSASASEILAGALRDHKVATLVGMHSFGKASVQNVRQLNDGSAVLLTIAKYLTPDGEYINKKGISAEVEVRLPTREAETVLEQDLPEEAQDVQLQKAIQVLKEKIQAANQVGSRQEQIGGKS